MFSFYRAIPKSSSAHEPFCYCMKKQQPGAGSIPAPARRFVTGDVLSQRTYELKHVLNLPLDSPHNLTLTQVGKTASSILKASRKPRGPRPNEVDVGAWHPSTHVTRGFPAHGEHFATIPILDIFDCFKIPYCRHVLRGNEA